MKNKIFSFLLVFSLLLCACSKTSRMPFNQEELKIVVTSDWHYLVQSYYENYTNFGKDLLKGDGKMTNYSDQIIDSFVTKMKEEQPDLIVITGDLTFNGELNSHQQLAKKLESLKDAGIEIAVLPGNHDINNIFARQFDDVKGAVQVESLDKETFQQTYQNLGYEEAKSIDEHSLSYRLDLNQHYSLLLVDSIQDSYQQNSALSEETMAWLEKELQAIQKEHKIPLIAMHHNLARHSNLLYEGYTLDNQEEMLSLLKQYHVPLTLSGHIHMQHIAKVENIYDIASSSLAISPVQYGILTLQQNSIDYKTAILENIEGDEIFFETAYYQRVYPKLKDVFDENTAEKMADYLAKVNRLYFSGEIYLHLDELKNDALYKQLLQKEDQLEFSISYLKSQLADTTNHQQLHIDLP